MIDFGLLMSMIVAVGVPELLSHRWPMHTYDQPVGFFDAALGPAFAGLVVARLTAVALDDPSSIGSISDLVIIRSGVEFWPGVAAAAVLVFWAARRSGVAPVARLADIAPLAMVGYAAYEAACVFRDGCFGPNSPLGLRPWGLSTTMLPIGLLMAVAVVVAAVVVRSFALRTWPPSITVLAAVVAVATIRSVGSIWLPHVGRGMTRQHLTSIAVSIAGAIALAVIVMRSERVRTRKLPTPTGASRSKGPI